MDTPLDFDEMLTPAEGAERLGVALERMTEILLAEPFGPLPDGPDGEPRILGALLHGFTRFPLEYRLNALDRVLDLTYRNLGPPEPLPDETLEFVVSDGPGSPAHRLETGELISAEALAGRLGWSVHEVLRAEHRGRLFSYTVNDIRYYPCYYADRSLDPRAVEWAFRLLVPIGPWSALWYLTSPRFTLRGDNHISQLRARRYERVEMAIFGHLEL